MALHFFYIQHAGTKRIVEVFGSDSGKRRLAEERLQRLGADYEIREHVIEIAADDAAAQTPGPAPGPSSRPLALRQLQNGGETRQNPKKECRRPGRYRRRGGPSL